jgi:hypothetical protein
LRRIDRPVAGIDLMDIWRGLQQFRQQYQGQLGIQSMLLAAWSDRDQLDYIALMQDLGPDEIQLNTPTRPRPLIHQLEARGNGHTDPPSYTVRHLKPISQGFLQEFVHRLQQAIGIPVRYPPLNS